MFILPIPRSPGEHGADDHTGGMIGRTRRSFPLNVHMDVNGFILCALLIQGLSTGGVMPTEVWVAEPGYALIVCFGLMALSACLLFSLKSLLTQPAEKQSQATNPTVTAHKHREAAAASAAHASEPTAGLALLVQSSRTTQAIIEKSLAKAGIQSISITDEQAAYERLEAGEVDLLIVDATRGKSGPSTSLQNFRGSSRSKGIPILALASDNCVNAEEFGADMMIAVPIVPQVLARAATNLIERASLKAGVGSSDVRPPSERELPKLQTQPLDARALRDLEKLGGRDFVCDIVAQFVTDAAAVLVSLATAVAHRDPKAFREQAHALRSCAANVGAQNVYRMCLAWRDLDAQEIAASGMQYMQMLEAEFERVRGALKPMLEQGEGGSGPDSKAA